MIQAWLLEEFNKYDELDSMALYHLSTGGKCLRGQLALAEAQSLDLPTDKARSWALACELLHNATLIHDDIQDNDSLRRGQTSLWQKFGLAHGINVGDLLIFRAFRHVAELNSPELTRLFSITAEQLARGQHQEICPEPPKKSQTCWPDYEGMTMKKTGALFLLPIQGCYILKQRPLPRELEKAWLQLGVAYQIFDDLRDFYGLKQTGQKQKDLHEGRINAIITRLYELDSEKNLMDRYWKIQTLSKAQRLDMIAEIESQVHRYDLTDDLLSKAHLYLSTFQQHASLNTQKVINEFLYQALPSRKVNIYVPSKIYTP